MSFLIGIDALGIDQPGGARTAVFFLLNELFRQSPELNFIIYLSKEELAYNSYANVSQVILPYKKGLLSRIKAQVFFFFETYNKKFDLFHFTKSQGSFTFSKRKIITIFDLTILHNTTQFRTIDVLFWKYIQPIFLNHFDEIITISDDAKKDIHKYYNIPEQKIKTIYCSSQFDKLIPKNIELVRKFQEKYNLFEDYLLFLGIISLKKNLSTIVKAYKYLLDNGYNIPKLILAGPYYPQSDGSIIFDEIKKLGLGKKILYIGKVDQEDLIGLYQGSKLFLMPSTHEGFGIPILEALQCEVPVIASNSASIPEVLGQAGVLVDDFLNPLAWAKEIIGLLNDNQKCISLVEKSKEQVKKFSWESSGFLLKNLYLSNLVKK